RRHAGTGGFGVFAARRIDDGDVCVARRVAGRLVRDRRSLHAPRSGKDDSARGHRAGGQERLLARAAGGLDQDDPLDRTSLIDPAPSTSSWPTTTATAP